MADTVPLQANESQCTPIKTIGMKSNGAQEHEFGETNDQFELKFDFSGKLKNYASSRWRGWLKAVLYLVGGVAVVAVIGLLGYIATNSYKWKDERQIPGLELVSASDHIVFSQGIETTYKVYADYLQTYLESYSAMTTSSMKNCTQPGDKATPDQACIFNPYSLGEVCSFEEGDFGFDIGEPCVLLKVKRVQGWTPLPYEPLDSIPPAVQGHWKPDHIMVTCEGQTKKDRSYIWDIYYFPHSGIPTKFFPFIGQKIYQDPLLFVQVKNPTSHEDIHIKCELWSKDISEYDRRRVAVEFSLKVT